MWLCAVLWGKRANYNQPLAIDLSGHVHVLERAMTAKAKSSQVYSRWHRTSSRIEFRPWAAGQSVEYFPVYSVAKSLKYAAPPHTAFGWVVLRGYLVCTVDMYRYTVRTDTVDHIMFQICTCPIFLCRHARLRQPRLRWSLDSTAEEKRLAVTRNSYVIPPLQ